MRNLVLLLSSGHTVRIELRDDDLTHDGGPGNRETEDFLEGFPAIASYLDPGIVFAYIEDPTTPAWDNETGRFAPSNDLQRIDVSSPGDVPS